MTNKPGTVLVTGAGGLLGRHASDVFNRKGWKVVAANRSELDISIESEVLGRVAAIRPSLIINCAAATDVDRCEREPEYARLANEKGPEVLGRAASLCGAEIVHISTDYVFDGEKDGYYTQNDEPNPLSEYARSKLAGEIAVQRQSNRAYIVRSSWIFGKGGKNFGSRIFDYARGGKLKGVYDQTSIPTYAPDLADRLEEIVAKGTPGLYQVTNSKAATWLDFARFALDLAGMSDVAIEPVTRAQLNQPAPRPRNSAMRCLLSEKLGFAALRDWQEATREFVKAVFEDKE